MACGAGSSLPSALDGPGGFGLLGLEVSDLGERVRRAVAAVARAADLAAAHLIEQAPVVADPAPAGVLGRVAPHAGRVGERPPDVDPGQRLVDAELVEVQRVLVDVPHAAELGDDGL